jgi:hypothetical protein
MHTYEKRRCVKVCIAKPARGYHPRRIACTPRRPLTEWADRGRSLYDRGP